MPLLNQSTLHTRTAAGLPIEIRVPTWPIKPYVPNQVFYTPLPLPPSEDNQENDVVLKEEEEHVFPDEARREHGLPRPTGLHGRSRCLSGRFRRRTSGGRRSHGGRHWRGGERRFVDGRHTDGDASAGGRRGCRACSRGARGVKPAATGASCRQTGFEVCCGGVTGGQEEGGARRRVVGSRALGLCKGLLRTTVVPVRRTNQTNTTFSNAMVDNSRDAMIEARLHPSRGGGHQVLLLALLAPSSRQPQV